MVGKKGAFSRLQRFTTWDQIKTCHSIERYVTQLKKLNILSTVFLCVSLMTLKLITVRHLCQKRMNYLFKDLSVREILKE